MFCLLARPSQKTQNDNFFIFYFSSFCAKKKNDIVGNALQLEDYIFLRLPFHLSTKLTIDKANAHVTQL